MSMKFDMQKLHAKRVQLETEIRQIKKVLTQRHNEESPALQARKHVLRQKLTFIYTAIAYSREKVHVSGQWPNEQADWLIREIAVAKKHEELLKTAPNQQWLQDAAFAAGFFRTPVEQTDISPK